MRTFQCGTLRIRQNTTHDPSVYGNLISDRPAALGNRLAVASLNKKTAATKSVIIKRALLEYAFHSQEAAVGGLFALGEQQFGKFATAGSAVHRD